METGAVIAACPLENVKRIEPIEGDVVILLGGRTGRDGIGGATGSSKSHNVSSIETESAQVQKGNAPEERKIQRLFRNPEAAKLIKSVTTLVQVEFQLPLASLQTLLKSNLTRFH